MKKCPICGAAFEDWVRPEPKDPESIAQLDAIKAMGTVAGDYPPHVCPNCKHYWWFRENLMEDDVWPDDW